MFGRASKIASLRLGSSSAQLPAASCPVISRASSSRAALPKGSLGLDSSYQQLLQDIDITLKKHKLPPVPPPRELEVISGELASSSVPITPEDWIPLNVASESSLHEQDHDTEHRKSPAALFGSDQIGTVILPLELQAAINILIAERDKSEIRSDAKRLFTIPGTDGDSEGDWDTQYSNTYRSRTQAHRHSTRDGTAFATVALPAHYSAITTVLEHLKQRLGPELNIENVIDWGAATGSGLWASLYAFQKNVAVESKKAAYSTVKSYVGLDKREGLVAIGERLVSNTEAGKIKIHWKKTLQEEHKVPKKDQSKTLALSAFMLTSQPTSIAQKNLVREMWNSGAHTIVLIDHNNKEGFEAIAYAREYILRLGKEEIEEPEKATSDLLDAHVVAPCPHDRPCPLLHSGGAPLVCGFSQRFQRPAFVRRTKHSGVGHEDVGYSYVIMRRGPRPNAVMTDIGRTGAIGKRVLEKELAAAIPMKELEIHVEDPMAASMPEGGLEILSPSTAIEYAGRDLGESQLQELLRKEAYAWPRLVFAPMKRSGHIVLDSCTAEGKIMRLTIPKSQGKQPFYDARKSSWGDLFPHEPKIAPLERDQPKMRNRNKITVGTGGDIGKRQGLGKNKEGRSYDNLASLGMRPDKKRDKRSFALTRGTKVWEDRD